MVRVSYLIIYYLRGMDMKVLSANNTSVELIGQIN